MTDDGFRFVHLTDTHIMAGGTWRIRGGDVEFDTDASLRRGVEVVRALDPAPAFAVLGGDLASPDILHRERTLTAAEYAPSYARLKEILAGLPCRAHYMMGNHDNLEALNRALRPEAPADHRVRPSPPVAARPRVDGHDAAAQRGRVDGHPCPARPRQLADRRPRAQRAGDPARRADDAHHAVHVHPAVEDDGERRALRPGAAWLSCGRRRARPALVVRRARALIPCARIWVRPTVKHPAARRAKLADMSEPNIA